jgi:hypothetical protein
MNSHYLSQAKFNRETYNNLYLKREYQAQLEKKSIFNFGSEIFRVLQS